MLATRDAQPQPNEQFKLTKKIQNMPNDAKNRIDVLVQRQLDNIASGNGAYLETFLRVAKSSGLTTRLLFSPKHSFGNRPWAAVHPRLNLLADEICWPQTITSNKRYWSLSPSVWARFVIRVVKELFIRSGVQLNIDSYLGKPTSKKEQRALADICNADPSAITIAEYSSMAPVLSLIKAPTAKGVLMHDVLSDRATRFRAQGKEPDFLEISTAQEAAWCRDASLMIYASANELEEFSKAVPETSAVWLRPEPPKYGETPRDGPTKLVFIGTTHAGNTDALNHFIDDIWPLVRAASPETDFHIVGAIGKSLSNERKNVSGVKVLGRVDKLEEIGGPNAIGLAPTRLATGVSIKVAEYLVLDMPCVAYPLALQGFGDVLDEAVVIANTKEEFARIILDLIDNNEKRYRISVDGKATALDVLSNDDVEAFLQAALEATKENSE